MAASSIPFALNGGIDLSKLSISDPPPSESDQGHVGATSHLTPKLRDKLNKLAKWRIDPYLIEFQESARKFEGGYAIVSRALLTPASAKGTHSNKAPTAEGEQKGGDENIKKTIAVKKLKIKNEGDRERILGSALKEAGLLVGLSSEYIINLEGFVEDLSNNRIWLIFPWHEHGNLKDFVASQDWEIPERIYLIDDVARGVEYLHTQSPPIYHGDLKSINVLVTSKCRAVITDFGSARRLTKKHADAPTTRTEKEAHPAPEFQATFCATNNTMTFTGNQFTLRWAAPELLKDEEPTLSSDIWALGWIFYEVMTNSIPFEDVKRETVIIINVVYGKLPCVTEHVRMSLILRLSSLMVTCWNVDPTKRPTAEGCRRSMTWMPATVPVPERPSDSAVSRTRSPKLLMKLGNMHKHQNDYINASKLYSEALAIYKKTSNDAGKADALYSLGQAHAGQAELSKAATFHYEAYQIYTDIGDKRGRARALTGLAWSYYHLGNYSEAKTLLSKVIQASRLIGDEPGRANALKSLAAVHKIQGDYDQAITSNSEALAIYTRSGSIFGRSGALANIAEVKRMQTKYTEAVELFSESLKLSTDIGDRFGRAFALHGLADIHHAQDRPYDALRLYEEAVDIYAQIGRKDSVAFLSKSVAKVRHQLEGRQAE